MNWASVLVTAQNSTPKKQEVSVDLKHSGAEGTASGLLEPSTLNLHTSLLSKY